MSFDQARYDRLIANGCTERLADMLAARTGPAIKSGSKFMRNIAHDDGLTDIHPSMARQIREAADRAGVSRAGKRWDGGLASHPFDPRAWVSDEHDVRDLAHERGLEVHGLINVEGPGVPEPPPPTPLAPDIVREEVAIQLQNPENRGRDPRELAEQVIDEHSVKVASSTPRIPSAIREKLNRELGPEVFPSAD